MNTPSIDIKNLSGQTVATAVVTEQAILHEELMAADYVQLSWNSDTGTTLPAGAYITVDGERYSLLEPYEPTRANEAEYQYAPQFQSRIMGWQKHPVPLYTYEEDGSTVKTREFDWDFTGSPADAMYMVQQAILGETGEAWTVQLADSLPATISLSSQSSSIYAVLTDIAGQCDTEWWGDKATNTLYLAQCKHGTPVALTVGGNVGVPTVTAGKDGYFTRFYVFGSSRNVTQDSGAAATNSTVNRRLTLDPATYPGGYIDTKAGLQPGEIFTTTLYFDDIYPSSRLAISSVRARLKYRLDSNGNKIQTSTDDDGNPVYEQYAIWYFQIAGFDFDPSTIIPQKNLSARFETGQLGGRDFELTYHAEDDNRSYTDDAAPFQIHAGDYEIMLDESEGITIPGLAYIIPQDGDQVILYNIEMPAEYTASARQELAEAAQAEIARRTADNNSYEMDSYPHAFDTNGTDLTLGQAVSYTNGGTVLSTRVLMVEKHMDFPAQQRIRVGNAIIKGNTQQLREEVTQANQNIDILAAFNELSASLSNAYAKAQREMIEGFSAIKNMWKFDPEDPTVIYSDYSAYVNGFLSAKGQNPDAGGSVSGATDLGGLTDVTLTSPQNGQVLAYNGSQWVNKTLEAGLDETALAQYLTSNQYATQTWVNSQNYATVADLDARIDALVNGAPAAFDTLKEISDVLQGNVDSIGDILMALAGKADKTITITAGAGLTGGGDLSANRTMALATVGTAGTYTKVTVDAYGRVTGHASLAASDIPTLSISKITGLQSALDAKLDAATFNDLFEKVEISTGVYAIRAKYGLYSNDWISAKGANPDAGGAVSGASSLDELSDVALSNIQDGQVLAYDTATQKWVNKSVSAAGLDEEALAEYLTDNQYAKKGDISIAGLTDLHSSWDAVLKAQKPAWLTTVSLATISDLHASWDALLKAAPSVYVTRWPTASEVGALTQTTADGRYVRDNNASGTTDTNSALSNAVTHNYRWSNAPYNDISSLLDFTYSEDWRTQLFVKHQASTDIRVRSRYSGTTWGSWRTIAFTDSNVYSATKLQTARTINGTNFNGTANITTTKWGTARNIYIRDASQVHTGSAVSVDGSTNEYLLLPSTITATLSGNATTSSKWATARKLTLTGDVTGSVSMDGSANVSLATEVSDNVFTYRGRVTASGPNPTASELTTATLQGTYNVLYSGASGKLIVFRALGSSAVYTQIYHTYAGSMMWRSSQDSTLSGKAWRTLLDTNNYTSYLDSRYVNVSGDTMTGSLTVNTGTGTRLVLGSGIQLWANAAAGWARNFAVYNSSGESALTNGSIAGAYGSANTLYYTYYGGTYNSPAMVILPSNKYVGIGTTSPSYKLHVAGVAYASTGIFSDGYVSAKGNNSSSDIRLKNILCNIRPSLEAFAQAPLFRFAWKSDPGMVEIGSSAQYWKSVLPDTVKERDGWLEMGYGNIALAGVITIARDFETLEQRVDRLEKENGKLKKRIKELERRAA